VCTVVRNVTVSAPTIHGVQLLEKNGVVFVWMTVNFESEFYYMHGIKNYSNWYH